MFSPVLILLYMLIVGTDVKFLVYDLGNNNSTLTVNGHASPNIQAVANDSDIKNASFLVTWVPHMKKNITVMANKNYSLEDTNIVISVKKESGMLTTTNQPVKTVLLSSRYKSPPSRNRYSAQHFFPSQKPSISSSQSYKPVFNFLFTKRIKESSTKPTATIKTFKPTIRFDSKSSSRKTTSARPTFKPTLRISTPVLHSTSEKTTETASTKVTFRPTRRISTATTTSVKQFLPTITVGKIEVLSTAAISKKITTTARPSTLKSETSEVELVELTTNISTASHSSLVAAGTEESPVLEFFRSSLETIISLMFPVRHSLPDSSPKLSLSYIAMVLGMPVVTGAMFLLGLSPAHVIATAWLIPVGALMILPDNSI